MFLTSFLSTITTRATLPHLPAKFDAAAAAVAANAAFLTAIADAALEGGGAGDLAPLAASIADNLAATATPVAPADADKARYVLKNVARDWADECAPERDACYGRLVAALEKALPPPRDPVAAPLATRPRVLVPGCGLARLAVDVAARGYRAEGNEFSYYMLLASAFVLNHVPGGGGEEEGGGAESGDSSPFPPFTIHPHVLTPSNVVNDADQLRGVRVPSPHPASLLPAPGLLSMAAGDFCEIYARPTAAATADAVVTAFFIDTVPCVATAIDVIAHVLKPGGVWLNSGPLLYHWADAASYLPDAPPSIELCLADVMALVKAAGFEVTAGPTRAVASFNADPRSMARHAYVVAEWTAVKK